MSDFKEIELKARLDKAKEDEMKAQIIAGWMPSGKSMGQLINMIVEFYIWSFLALGLIIFVLEVFA